VGAQLIWRYSSCTLRTKKEEIEWIGRSDDIQEYSCVVGNHLCLLQFREGASAREGGDREVDSIPIKGYRQEIALKFTRCSCFVSSIAYKSLVSFPISSKAFVGR
jgi:hypothetical protein